MHSRRTTYRVSFVWTSVVSALLGSVPVTMADAGDRVFPGASWEERGPAGCGLVAGPLDSIAALLGGRGCVVRHGYVVKSWGDQAATGGWMSSSKPVISTLLFFAAEEGRIAGTDAPIGEFGWELGAHDARITFHHLANMIGGYARPERPGEAFAYNDFAINLYRLTLFDRVYEDDPTAVANDPDRLGALQFEHGLSFTDRAHVIASVRDFARLGWFWLGRGRWHDRQLLDARFFEDYVRPHVPKLLPHTQEAETDDYLGIGSYGGGSDHFTTAGPGIYGYNFWFNDTGRDHPDRVTWPDAPRDAYMTIGAGGNSSVIIPSLDMVISAARANWGNPRPGDARSQMNRVMRLAGRAVTAAADSGAPPGQGNAP